MNSIIWNGVSSTTIKGLLICELPPISKPPMRVNETFIEGKDGSEIEEYGYDAYNKVLKIGLRGDFEINEVIKYFSGSGNVVFSNEPDKYYKAHIIGQIDYNRLCRFRTAEIVFRVQPFKYKWSEREVFTEVTTAVPEDIFVTNEGNIPCKPLIILNGSGVVGCTVNGVEIFSYEFPDGENEVYIDSEKEDAYLGNALKNRYMTGEFPKFISGMNTISLSGAVHSVRILPNSRWL